MEDESYMQQSRKRPLEVSDRSYASGKPTLKFLVSNFMAGKLIGKGGSNIGELQSKFNASIEVSPNKEFYPGTKNRIVSVSADIDQIIAFCNHTICEIEQDQKSESNTNPRIKEEFKLIISSVAAGLVIGKGGASVKAIQTASHGARIDISKKEESIVGERVVVISGDAVQRAAACKQAIEVMSAAPEMSNSNLEYSSFNTPMQKPQNNLPNYQTYNSNFMHPNINNSVNNMSMVGNHGNNYDNSNYQAKSGAKAKFHVEVEIPNNMVGTILGRQGQTIIEFSRRSGAKLQFSGKDEFTPGTTNRLLTITGGMYQVQNAYILVDDKLAQVEAEFSGGFARH